MSRGLGHWQTRILDFLKETKDHPVWTKNLLTEGLGLELPLEPAVYSAIRRATASLVKKGLLCTSHGGMRYGCNQYWLPGQPGGAVQRKIPLSLVKLGLLKCLAGGEKRYSEVTSQILGHLGNEPRVRTAITRAAQALEREGRVHRVQDANGNTVRIRVA